MSAPAPRIAVVSFPGNNCEVESMRAIRQAGMEPQFFRWNDDRALLEGVAGYFIPGGFSYEDRGRSGMVAGRDDLMDFIGQEAEAGKVVIGNCNGAQILIESGMIPLGEGLRMSLARNALKDASGVRSPGFLSEWVWIRPSCAATRCATSDWNEPMHLPIAHGEGRFITTDPDLIAALHEREQIAFSYCDAQGKISMDASVTPNGSTEGIAGICNPAGNVVALMPHPERTQNGNPYFASLRTWIQKSTKQFESIKKDSPSPWNMPERTARGMEIFIDTIIVNNEERTVEQIAKKFVPGIRLKQWKYFSLKTSDPSIVLGNLALFNMNKERAYIRRGDEIARWNGVKKSEEPLASAEVKAILAGIALLRRDVPDTGAAGLGANAETGVCYVCTNASEQKLFLPVALEVFANPHASTLERMVF